MLLFLLEHAPLERWERDVLAIIREEAYYFAPQVQTKIMNEGWACLHSNTLVFTDSGVLRMKALVEGSGGTVCDGERERAVYDRHVIRQHETVTIRTRRGMKLCGSNNHRVLLADGTTWKRLDELAVGDEVAVRAGRGSGRRPRSSSTGGLRSASGSSRWRQRPAFRSTRCSDIAPGSGLSARLRVASALEIYDSPENQAVSTNVKRRRAIAIPERVGVELGAFLGYLIGDGHISRVKRNFGITTGDDDQALAFLDLGRQLFGLSASLKWDDGRYRVLFHSETAADFLVEALGLTTGPSAHEKKIPDAILRSPEPVVRAFLRAYFDCGGYAGKQGIILSTMSDALAEEVQLLLLIFGVLSRIRRQTDGAWHVHVAGESALQFAAKIGFGLARKKEELEKYLAHRRWFKKESWTDEVVSIEHGRDDVYDISVEETHRYAAGGFINHNSYWHSKLMTTKVLDASEIVEYADHNAGVMATAPGRLNPYKIGVELLSLCRGSLEQGAIRARVGGVHGSRSKAELGHAPRARAREDFPGARALQRRHLHRRVLDAGVLRRNEDVYVRVFGAK